MNNNQLTLFGNGVFVKVKPFLKWAGGKGQLLDEIEKRLPEDIKTSKIIESYIEPFVGGGAVFFYLKNQYTVKESTIIDNNRELIIGYKVVKKNPEELVSELEKLEKKYKNKDEPERKAFFYDQRDSYNKQMHEFDYQQYSHDWINRAVYLIFLNRTCFNGLFRQNSKGEFNVPFGRYKNPTICNRENILQVHKALQDTTILCGDFSLAKKIVKKNSFVYFDPPYRPLNATSNFTDYSKSSFNDDEQIRLADFFKELDKQEAILMLSNSDPKNEDPNDNFFDDLYKEFKINRIKAKRVISSKGDKRGEINELLIRNYPKDLVKDDDLMKKERIYFEKLKIDNFDALLHAFFDSIIDTNRTYDFFVDWKKIKDRINDTEAKLDIKLNILNSLVGTKNFDDKFKNLLLDYPEVLPIIPMLIAVRDISFPVIADFYSKKIDIKRFDFSERKLSEKEIDNFLEFVQKTGLKLFFTELANRSLLDYYLGVEVGMDTNARKNRSGDIMEKVINHYLDDINKKQNFPFPILKQKTFGFLEKEHNFPVNSDIKNRKADFIIIKDFNKPINIEVNFFTGSGSKPQEIVDAYILRQRELAQNNISFIWITDGYGWKKQRNQTKKGFNKIDYLLNIDFVKKGILEEILKTI